MAKPQVSPDTTLQIKRTFQAPRERVFRAWTQASELAQWFAPTPDHTTIVPELDLRVGGKYRLEIHHKAGNVHKLAGAYKEIDPPKKVVFTWTWEGQPGAAESVVTVEFRDLGDATEIVMTHEGLPSIEEREKHVHGWTGCFEQLAKFV